MIAKLLRYPSGTATLTERLDSFGNDLPDFLRTGTVAALQCRHEQGIGPDGANTEVVHRWPHHEPSRLLDLDLHLAEHPGRLVIPASRKNISGPELLARIRALNGQTPVVTGVAGAEVSGLPQGSVL
jgi:hypothetical protein